MKDWIERRPQLSIMFLAVAIAHVLLLQLLPMHRIIVAAPPQTPRVAVQQVKLQPPPPVQRPVAKPKPKPKPVAKPKPKPKPKPAVQSKPKPKPRPDKRNQELLEQARRSLAQIDMQQPAPVELAPPPTPRPAPKPAAVTAARSRERDYVEELVRGMRQQLSLPDYGDVTLRLTLDRRGRVTGVSILESFSEKNRLYIENRLPHLAFAPFGDRFASEDAQSFTLTLSNE